MIILASHLSTPRRWRAFSRFRMTIAPHTVDAGVGFARTRGFKTSSPKYSGAASYML